MYCDKNNYIIIGNIRKWVSKILNKKQSVTKLNYCIKLGKRKKITEKYYSKKKLVNKELETNNNSNNNNTINNVAANDDDDAGEW